MRRNTEIRILTSGALCAQVVDALGLDRVKGFGQLRESPPLDRSVARQLAVTAVRDGLSVKPVSNSYAVSLRFRTTDPTIAATIVNRLVDLYVADRFRNRDGKDTLMQNLSAAREALSRAQAAEDGYAQAAMLIKADRAPGTDIASLSTALAVARDVERKARARLRAAAPGVSDGSEGGLLPILEKRRAQRIAEGDPVTPASDNELMTARRRYRQLLDQAAAASQRVAQLVASRELAQADIANDHQADVRLDSLKTEVAGARTRYIALMEQARVRSSVQGNARSTAYVISRASARSARRFPDIATVLIAASIAGVGLSLMLLILLERLQKGVTMRDPLEKALGIPVIGVVQDLSRHPDIPMPRTALSVPNYLTRNQDTFFARSIRAIIDDMARSGGGSSHKIVAISSALPEEGKTTTALCLARAAVANGSNTLLIDCDLRRPAASRALFRQPGPGLLEVLEGSISVAEALRKDEYSDLQVIPVNIEKHSDSPSINIAKMKELLAEMRDRFDLVICDMPPALALSEARQVSQLADAALLVVRFRHTPTDAVMIAHDLMKRANVPVIAAILTLVDKRSMPLLVPE